MNSDTIRIGLSPCPNDTFICHALLHHKIDTEGLHFEPDFDDVESLNNKAFHGISDVTKLSFHAFLYLVQTYALLDAGAALGRGCGPLLIARRPIPAEEINALCIAVPGAYTTASLLLSLAFPRAHDKDMMVFSAIEQAVLEGRCDAGVIIHESRFTYQDKGLVCLADLGQWWEKNSGHPIPLGGFAVNRMLDKDLQLKVQRVLRRSVDYAMLHPDASAVFVAQYARELKADVRRAHINLYVNDYSRGLGQAGREAIECLFQRALQAGLGLRLPESFSALYV